MNEIIVTNYSETLDLQLVDCKASFPAFEKYLGELGYWKAMEKVLREMLASGITAIQASVFVYEFTGYAKEHTGLNLFEDPEYSMAKHDKLFIKVFKKDGKKAIEGNYKFASR